MKNRYYPIILFLFSLLASHNSSAQDYAGNIEEASRAYEAGKATDCISLLKSTTSNSEVPVNYRWQAFRLSSMAFLLQGDEDMAKDMAIEFMRLNPTYKPNPVSDSRDFRALLDKIVVIPKFSLGIAATAGTNVTIPKLISSYGTSGYVKTYRSLGSYQFGINIGYSLSERISLNLGFSNIGKSFRTEYALYPWKYTVTERMQFLEVPLSMRYSFFKNNRTRPYVFGGAFYGLLNASSNDFTKESPDKLENYSTERLSSMNRRNRSQFGLFGGTGISYRLWKGHVNAELGYYHGFTNITKQSTRYSYLNLTQRYEYLDDDLRLSNIMFSIGYTYYINYHVKESTN